MINSVVAVVFIFLVGFCPTECEVITVERSSRAGANHGARPLTKSAFEGGNGWRQFDDIADHDLGLAPIAGVRSFSISYRDKVDSIQVTYIWSRRVGLNANEALFRAPRHGILKSLPTRITLETYEHIVKVEGQTDGRYVNQLTFFTDGSNLGRKMYGPFGKNGSCQFSFDGYIVAFYGQNGLLHLNSIGVYSLQLLRKSNAVAREGLPLMTMPILDLLMWDYHS